ncbi:MAG: hypothetical protein WB677_24430 [Xanthobacteraceae bacterium]
MWTFITSLAALVAVFIVYLQWNTAQTKVALDIHATRYAIYQDLREAVTMFAREVRFSLDAQVKYMDAQSRARFHFGAEDEIRRAMIVGDLFDRYPHVSLLGKVDEQVARLDRINAFYSEIDRMFVPYMRLDQRMPLWWWTPFATKIKERASGMANSAQDTLALGRRLLERLGQAPRSDEAERD